MAMASDGAPMPDGWYHAVNDDPSQAKNQREHDEWLRETSRPQPITPQPGLGAGGR